MTSPEQKWCKAVWYRRGSSGAQESEAIPRSWVSKSRNIIKWPPSNFNYKSAIESCMAPPPEDSNWGTYVLISCTETVSSLDEARMLTTEVSDNEGDMFSDDEVPLTQRSSPSLEPQVGRRKRTVTENPKYKDFVRDEKSPTRKIRITRLLGEENYSTLELHRITQSSTSRESETPIRKTTARERDSGQDSDSPTQSFTQSVDRTPTGRNSCQESDTRSSSSSLSQIQKLIIELSAQSRIRHEEIVERIDSLERTLTTMRQNSVGDDSTSEDSDITVALPVTTFAEFDRLEMELSDTPKRRKLVSASV